MHNVYFLDCLMYLFRKYVVNYEYGVLNTLFLAVTNKFWREGLGLVAINYVIYLLYRHGNEQCVCCTIVDIFFTLFSVQLHSYLLQLYTDLYKVGGANLESSDRKCS